MATKCGFVQPSDFGFNTPINTPRELQRIARAINGLPDKPEQKQQETRNTDGLNKQNDSSRKR